MSKPTYEELEVLLAETTHELAVEKRANWIQRFHKDTWKAKMQGVPKEERPKWAPPLVVGEDEEGVGS